MTGKFSNTHLLLLCYVLLMDKKDICRENCISHMQLFFHFQLLCDEILNDFESMDFDDFLVSIYLFSAGFFQDVLIFYQEFKGWSMLAGLKKSEN